jgi:hypothetical protein
MPTKLKILHQAQGGLLHATKVGTLKDVEDSQRIQISANTAR